MIMRPLYRYLSHAQPPLAGNKQNLWIKSPALDPLQRENSLRCRPIESLEAALRIPIVQPQHYSQQQIE